MEKTWTKERREAQKNRKLWERSVPSEATINNKIKARKVFVSRRTAIINKFKEGGCQICGEKDIRCLDFHHIIADDKEGAVAHMRSAPIDNLESEIKKCIVLCANCHRKIHSGESHQKKPPKKCECGRIKYKTKPCPCGRDDQPEAAPIKKAISIEVVPPLQPRPRRAWDISDELKNQLSKLHS
jgi:hypothetical protein